MVMQRHPARPLLSRTDIPDLPPDIVDVSSVFNPGATVFEDQLLLMLRVQTRGRRTYLLVARSDDGLAFDIESTPVEFDGIGKVGETIHHIYDPRITRIGDEYHIVCALDIDKGCRLGIVRTLDFENFTFLGLVGNHDTRNGVLFPEKIGGRYLMLERPNTARDAAGYPADSTIVLSASDDLLNWQQIGPVMSGRWHYWDELIGSGPPPVKTRDGWLHLYHGIATHYGFGHVYQAGAVLLDLQDPTRVLARTDNNILEPRQSYELTGQVPNVVFPSGMVVSNLGDDGYADDQSIISVFYGAADTVIGHATASVGELIRACRD